MFKQALAAAGLALAALATAAPAHADDASYLAYLDDHGFVGNKTYHVFTSPTFPPGQVVEFGHSVCNNLHAGLSPDGGSSTWNVPEFPLIVDAAQHELCPDTLGGA